MKKLILLLLTIPLLLGTDYARKYPTNTPLEVVTPSSLSGLESDPLSLHLDQSSPQTLTASPILNWGTSTRIPYYHTDKTLTDSEKFVFDVINGLNLSDLKITTTGTLGAGVGTLTSLNLTADTTQIVLDSDGTFTTTLTDSAATSSKTITLPNFTGTLYISGGTDVAVADGGTNISSYTIGDLLYASNTTTLSKLADVAIGSVFVSGGVGVAPAWSATPSVTSLTASGTIQAEHLYTTDDLQVADDILLGSGSILNFNSGNVTITHSAGALNFGSANLTTTGTLGAGVTTLTGNNGNNAFTLLNLNNNVTPTTGQVGQTSDLIFNLTQSINSVASLHEAARISAYKVSDWFHASAETDTDSGLKFYTTKDGTAGHRWTMDESGNFTTEGGKIQASVSAGSLILDSLDSSSSSEIIFQIGGNTYFRVTGAGLYPDSDIYMNGGMLDTGSGTIATYSAYIEEAYITKSYITTEDPDIVVLSPITLQRASDLLAYVPAEKIGISLFSDGNKLYAVFGEDYYEIPLTLVGKLPKPSVQIPQTEPYYYHDKYDGQVKMINKPVKNAPYELAAGEKLNSKTGVITNGEQ